MRAQALPEYIQHDIHHEYGAKATPDLASDWALPTFPRIQTSSFTPINVDSQGYSLISPPTDTRGLEIQLQRHKAQDRNPWTPRKPRKRPRLQQNRNTADLHPVVSGDATNPVIATNHRATASAKDFAPSQATLLKLQCFRYNPSPGDSGKAPAEPHGDIGPAAMRQIPIKSCSDAEFSEYTDPHDHLGTEVRRGSPRLRKEFTGYIDPPSTATGPVVLSMTQPFTTGGSTYMCKDVPSLNNVPKEVWAEVKELACMGPDDLNLEDAVALWDHCSDNEVWQESTTSTEKDLEYKPGACVRFPKGIACPEESLDIEALDNINTGLVVSSPPHDCCHSDYPAAPYPGDPNSGKSNGALGLLTSEDLFDELDDEDVFDLIDAANQVDASRPPDLSNDPPESPTAPRLCWNTPKEFRKMQERPENGQEIQKETISRTPSMQKHDPASESLSGGYNENLEARVSDIKENSATTCELDRVSADPLKAPVNQCLSPFVRGALPNLVRDRSPIQGITSQPSLRVCFRLGELLKAAKMAANENLAIFVELYARVDSRKERPGELEFTLADLFFPERPPHLQALWRGWRTNEYWIVDAETLAPGVICRAVGQVEKNSLGGEWAMNILSAQQVSWDDVEYVKGIVCAQ